MLVATQGDTHILHAYNGLGDDKIPTALHAHGMFFNGTNYYDGATGVTQCGIPSGQTLDYHIDTSLNHGTYWIHGHYNGQYVDGLRSPNIIFPKANRTDNTTWDEEYVVVASDWYHKQHQDMLDNEFLTWTNPTGAEPVPESALIYVAKDGKYIGNVATGESTNDNAKIHFEAGKKYRLRIINQSALAMFHIAIEDHDIYVIETDGVEVEPYKLDMLTISVAQRYSLLVEAKPAAQANRNYAMMFLQSEDMYDAVPEELILNNTVQVVYSDSAPNAAPIEFDEYPEIDDVWFKPLEKIASAPADRQVVLHAFFDTFNDGTNRASFTEDNGYQNSTYIFPQVPSIVSALSMGEDANKVEIYGKQTNAIVLEHMQNIELRVHNWDAGFHPFHLHGHTFQVIQKSFDIDSEDPAINPPLVDQQDNPARRDTITIPPQGFVVLRFRADNPGAWFFHCHIDWHLSSGLATVFIEGPDYMQKQLKMPDQMLDHCKALNIATSGNVVGKMSATDMKGEPWGPFPLVMGWTPRAIGAMAGCIIAFLVGFATIVWYAAGGLNEEELEEEVRRDVERKQNKKSLFSKIKGGRA